MFAQVLACKNILFTFSRHDKAKVHKLQYSIAGGWKLSRKAIFIKKIKRERSSLSYSGANAMFDATISVLFTNHMQSILTRP